MKAKISNNVMLLAILAFLVVTAGLQTWQQMTLISLLQSGSLAAGSQQAASPLAGLAAQVGGCGG